MCELLVVRPEFEAHRGQAVMEERFSDRLGITRQRAIQVDSIDDGLRATIWNLLHELFAERQASSRWPNGAKSLAAWFFKEPVDSVPSYDAWRSMEWVKKRFFVLPWYFVYNLLEGLVPRIQSLAGVHPIDYQNTVNGVLANERSGYLFVHGRLEPITSKAEIAEIDAALAATAKSSLADVHTQLDNALKCLAQRPKPDSTNAIKEAITAVETLVKTVLDVHGSGLKDALTEFSARAGIHSALRDSCLKLYAYASDDPGVRHGSSKKMTAGIAEARLVVIASSSFIHYFVETASAKGLLKSPPARTR